MYSGYYTDLGVLIADVLAQNCNNSIRQQIINSEWENRL